MSTEIMPAVLALREKIGTEMEQELGAIEMKVTTSYTLADAIREGSSVTGKQENGWIEGENACALGAGYIAAQARGYIK